MTQENPYIASTDVLQEYFQNGKQSLVNEMTDEQMKNLLLEFETTPHWIAYLKYVNSRLSLAQSGVNISDPFKEPTNIARNQGVMMGLIDTQNAVIMLVHQRAQETRTISENTQA